MISLKELLENNREISDEEIDNIVEAIELHPVKLQSIDSKIFPFEIYGKKYEVRIDKKLTPDEETIADCKFIYINNPPAPIRKNFDTEHQYQIALKNSMAGITGTGTPFKVLSEVLSIIAEYLKIENIKYITFTAIEKNRQILYKKILEKLVEKYNIPYKKLDINPINGEKLNDEEFWLRKV